MNQPLPTVPFPDRNDVPGAVACAKRLIEIHGHLPEDAGEILMMLQDDPDEFIQAIGPFLPDD